MTRPTRTTRTSRVLGALVAAALTLTTGALATTASAQPPSYTPPSGTHTLVTGGLALDVPGSSSNDGTQLDTATVNGGTSQNWQFDQQPDGSYHLVNGSSGRCAEVNGGSLNAGAVVDQWKCDSTSTNEFWTLTSLSNGSYVVSSVRSGLVLTAASSADGATLTQQVNTNSPQQQWTIGSTLPLLSGTHSLVTGGQALLNDGQPITRSVNDPLPPDSGAVESWQFVRTAAYTYKIVSVPTDSCVILDSTHEIVEQGDCAGPGSAWAITTLSNGSFTIASEPTGQLLTSNGEGALVTLQPNSNSPQQQWTIGPDTPVPSGVHTLVTGGLALDVPGGSSNDGTQLDTATVNGGTSQNWQFDQQPDGSYHLVNSSSGRCAEVNGGSLNAGAVVDQWKCDSTSTNEFWTLTPLSNGSYLVSSVRSGLVLTAASTADGATLTQQVNTNSPQQQWTIS
ncbi:RICIN domain-containing protein [Kitasatospora viridis]|nr:RICIN domain-containing protein [Kitasatospora viridis]